MEVAPVMGIEEKASYIIRWMKEMAAGAGAKGGVFGVSGGVDSSLVLALAVRAWPEGSLGVVMPCHSLESDMTDALYLLDLHKCPRKVVDLTPAYDVMEQSLTSETGRGGLSRLGGLGGRGGLGGLALANLKPRLRMMTLYYEAAVGNYLVVGTGNKSERHVGYFTKYGDGGVDIAPIANLVKAEVRQMAAYLGVPQHLVDKVPSGGLWAGQTDEGEMGITYKDLDDYLLGREVAPDVRALIERKHESTAHKRRLAPSPDFS